MTRLSNFVNLLDRYVEVSHVYHQGMTGNDVKVLVNDVKGRVTRLVALIESVPDGPPKSPLATLSPERSGGQAVVPTNDVLFITQLYQKNVLERLASKDTPVSPHNIAKLRAVLKLDPAEFLGYFHTPSYAWDVLTELSSLSVVPDPPTLAARDMIHMHAIELQLHLARVIAQSRLSSPSQEIALTGVITVDQLNKLQSANRLVDKLVEFAVPRDPADLLNELAPLVGKLEGVARIIDNRRDDVLRRLQQETLAFPDTLEESAIRHKAVDVCDMFVIFGLAAAYSAWFGVATAGIDGGMEQAALRKHILFCTRILLDEKRWVVCREVGAMALEILPELNKTSNPERPLDGTYMPRANWFFARQMAGEAVEDEVRQWEVNGEDVHPRYGFLKQVLIGSFAEAAAVGRRLLVEVEETNRTNLCIEEVKEWPILQGFRDSPDGEGLLREFGS